MNAGVYIGNKIKELRISNGLSQAATADALSMPLRTYQTWEKDYTSSVQNLINICSYFKVSVGSFLNSIQDGSIESAGGAEEKCNCAGIEEYKIKLFEMALEGRDKDYIFNWYRNEYPHQAALVDDKSKFLKNCFLDIYHSRHKG